jgi:predicted DNA-binding protein with PD1-like motif
LKSHVSERSRHILVRGEAGEVLPDALARALHEREVACGWVRASGVLTDVELRAFASDTGKPGITRRIAGPVQAVAIEGSVGLSRGEVTVGLRTVIARETDRGMETIAGELVSARVVALEAVVLAFDDVVMGRALDPAAGVWLFTDVSSAPAPAPPAARPREATLAPVEIAAPPAPSPSPPAARPVEARAAEPAAAWSEVITASADVDPARAAVRPGGGTAVMPQRPRPPTRDDDVVVPEAGDAVEHFAFGRAEVLKSDGERLHLRVHKDGKIREIAIEMLKVTELESNGQRRRFKLERKL